MTSTTLSARSDRDELLSHRTESARLVLAYGPPPLPLGFVKRWLSVSQAPGPILTPLAKSLNDSSGSSAASRTGAINRKSTGRSERSSTCLFSWIPRCFNSRLTRFLSSWTAFGRRVPLYVGNCSLCFTRWVASLFRWPPAKRRQALAIAQIARDVPVSNREALSFSHPA